MAEKDTKTSEHEDGEKEEDEKITVVTQEDLDKRAAAGETSDSDEEEEEEEEEESRLGTSEETEQERDLRASRRKENKSRRQRQREGREKLERKLAFLEHRNEELERNQSEIVARQLQGEQTSIQAEINRVKAAIKKADDAYAEAVSHSRGEDAAEAGNIKTNLERHLAGLEGRQKELQESTEETGQATLHPSAERYAKKWMEDNPWFNPMGRDRDSRIISLIDDELTAQRYDPRSEDYWIELTKQAAEVLPHRFKKKTRQKDDEDEEEGERPEKGNGKDSKGGGPRFGDSRGMGRQLEKGEFFLSQDRIDAMKEMGIWEDEAERNKMIKKYRQYDQEHGLDTSYPTH